MQKSHCKKGARLADNSCRVFSSSSNFLKSPGRWHHCRDLRAEFRGAGGCRTQSSNFTVRRDQEAAVNFAVTDEPNLFQKTLVVRLHFQGVWPLTWALLEMRSIKLRWYDKFLAPTFHVQLQLRTLVKMLPREQTPQKRFDTLSLMPI